MTSHPRTPAVPASLALALAALLSVAAIVAGCAPIGAGDADAAAPGAGTPIPAGVDTNGPAVAEASPAVVAAGSAAPATVPPATSAPDPTPSPVPATPAPPLKAYALNLYRAGDFVAQYTFEWCVGASLQMALNITTDDEDTSRAYQEELWTMAQARSDSPFGGANPLGWTAALNDLGVGPYQLVSIPDFDEALRVAAAAIRETRRPVGLVMWRGRHAWVMSGFESMGDPRVRDDFRVTGVRVLDPLYPHGSTVWGPSPKPNALVSPSTLARQFVIRDRGRHEPWCSAGVSPGPARQRGRLSEPVDSPGLYPPSTAISESGIANPNSAPPPSRGFAQIRPPRASTMRWQTGNPSPIPLARRCAAGDR